ncbi:MAG TPA: AMP-binding protein, partial [Solirubrobacterales bacterium]|nr:AMP-binding protein [Solirubrobacterales bacterium]
MEHATASQPGAATKGIGTGSKTIADLLPLAAEKYGSTAAVKCKNDHGSWETRSFADLGETVRSIALGLLGLGIEHAEKVAILANTRPEWTYVDFAGLSIGATVVPIYQTNSPDECEYVLENSDSVAVFVEDAEQLAKVNQVRERLPKLQHV